MFNNNHMNRQVVSFTLSYRISEIKFKDKRAKGLGGGGEELAPGESTTVTVTVTLKTTPTTQKESSAEIGFALEASPKE